MRVGIDVIDYEEKAFHQTKYGMYASHWQSLCSAIYKRNHIVEVIV